MGGLTEDVPLLIFIFINPRNINNLSKDPFGYDIAYFEL